MTRTNFLQLKPSVRLVPAQIASKHFTVERAAKPLHRMSPCTPVSVPAKKITWILTSIISEKDGHIIITMSNSIVIIDLFPMSSCIATR